MIEPISFFVAGEPKGQPRPRAFFNKHTGRASVFDAGTAEAWKGAVAAEGAKHRPGMPLGGPVSLRIRFFMPRPKGHYIANKPERGLRQNAPVRHVAKPDADNMAKAVMDALTQCGWYWMDDSQVAILTVAKNYSRNLGTGAEIEIAEVLP